jgi:hypothetical protein
VSSRRRAPYAQESADPPALLTEVAAVAGWRAEVEFRISAASELLKSAGASGRALGEILRVKRGVAGFRMVRWVPSVGS